VAQSEESMAGFTRMQGGVISPAEFFSPDNIGKIMAAAGAPAPA
jgi:hypothetical protein